MPKFNIVPTLVALFALALVLNITYPFMSDDYVFRFVWRGDYDSMYFMHSDYPLRRIENIGDVLDSLQSKYYTWGGRMITWSLAYFFANMPDMFFDAANSLMLVVFVILLTMLGTQKFSLAELDPRWLVLTFLLLWGASTMFANAYLWMAGSVGYLWTAVPQLLFLLLYVRGFWREERHRISPALMFVLGILAGWSNENSGAVTILLAAGLVYRFWRAGKLDSWHIWGIAGACIGFVALITAPGNFVRMAGTAASPALIADYARQSRRLAMFLLFCLPLLLIYLRLPKLRRESSRQKSFWLAAGFLAAGAVNFLVMLPVPSLPLRSLTGTVIFWIVGALAILSIDREIWEERFFRRVGAAYLLITTLTLGAYIYAMGAYLAPQDKERDELAAQNAGQDLVIAPYHGPAAVINAAVIKGYRADIGTVSENPESWSNVLYAAYWHLHSVKRPAFYQADD